MSQRLEIVNEQINEIREPLIKEIRNAKKENEGLLNELKRT